jgi:hypothetical protein
MKRCMIHLCALALRPRNWRFYVAGIRREFFP